jgi:hypothetical protein
MAKFDGSEAGGRSPQLFLPPLTVSARPLTVSQRQGTVSWPGARLSERTKKEVLTAKDRGAERQSSFLPLARQYKCAILLAHNQAELDDYCLIGPDHRIDIVPSYLRSSDRALYLG